MNRPIRIQTCRKFSALLATLLLPLLVIVSQASTIRQVGVSDLINKSQLVVHGRVIEKWTDMDQSTGAIFTRVRISIVEAIKGSYQQEDIVLSFMGGTFAGMTLDVAEMNVPIVGEEGIYFIERTNRVQVNPLFGWHQGHFVVRYADDGRTKMIMTHDLRPVFDIQGAEMTATIQFSDGVALGIRTQERSDDVPLSLGSFKARLKELNEVLK